MKIKKSVYINDLVCWVNAETVIKQLQGYIHQYGAGNVHIENSTDPYSSETSYEIYIYREETDEEYEQRLSQEKASQEIREQRERQEFERLQAKYGGKQ